MSQNKLVTTATFFGVSAAAVGAFSTSSLASVVSLYGASPVVQFCYENSGVAALILAAIAAIALGAHILGRDLGAFADALNDTALAMRARELHPFIDEFKKLADADPKATWQAYAKAWRTHSEHFPVALQPLMADLERRFA